MKYPGLFKNYQPLEGSDWLTRLPEEEVRVFVDIGHTEGDHGRLGGVALYEQRGVEHMQSIGRVGACVTNVRKWWREQVAQETYDTGVLVYKEAR